MLYFNEVFFLAQIILSHYVPEVIVTKQDSWYVHTTSKCLLFQYKLTEYSENKFQED